MRIDENNLHLHLIRFFLFCGKTVIFSIFHFYISSNSSIVDHLVNGNSVNYQESQLLGIVIFRHCMSILLERGFLLGEFK